MPYVSVLSTQISAVANSGSSETDLMSYSVPADTLGANGDSLRITLSFDRDASLAKTVNFYFGGSVFLSKVWTDTNDGGLAVTVLITRRTVSLQRVLVDSREFTTAAASIAADLTSVNVFKVTGQSAASDAITLHQMIVEYIPAP